MTTTTHGQSNRQKKFKEDHN